MIVNIQQLLFDIILFIYGLVAILFATRIVWLTKEKVNEAFQFLLIAITTWSIVKLLAVLADLKLLNSYAIGLGELFFISLLIIGAWYINKMFLGIKKQNSKKKMKKK